MSGFKAFRNYLPARRSTNGFLRIDFFSPFSWLVNPRVNDWVKIITNLLSNKVTIFLLGILGQWFLDRYSHWASLRKWRQQIFLDRVQAVLFSASPRQIESGRVEKRTMFEVDLTNVLNGNEAAAEEVRIAASKCTKDEPFITQHLAPSERYHVLNAVLNCVSCQYSSGHLIADLGGSYVSDWYAFAITAEVVGATNDSSLPNFVPSLLRGKTPKNNKNKTLEDTRTKKLRIILVKESILQSISDNHALYVEFRGVSGRHDHRWKMLHRMGEMLLRQALDGSNRHILRVMLSVPSSSVGNDVKLQLQRMSTPPAMMPSYLQPGTQKIKHSHRLPKTEQVRESKLNPSFGNLVQQEQMVLHQHPEEETPRNVDLQLGENVVVQNDHHQQQDRENAVALRHLNITATSINSINNGVDNITNQSPAMYTPRRQNK